VSEGPGEPAGGTHAVEDTAAVAQDEPVMEGRVQGTETEIDESKVGVLLGGSMVSWGILVGSGVGFPSVPIESVAIKELEIRKK